MHPQMSSRLSFNLYQRLYNTAVGPTKISSPVGKYQKTVPSSGAHSIGSKCCELDIVVKG